MIFMLRPALTDYCVNTGSDSHLSPKLHIYNYALSCVYTKHSFLSFQVLKKLVPATVFLPADDRYPDCVFIEDTAVVVDGVALVTIPGEPHRQQWDYL